MLKGLCALLGCIMSAAVLSGCGPNAAVTSPGPAYREDALGPRVAPRSQESLQLEQRLASMQAQQLTYGLLRRDGGGHDAQFTRDDLVRNFLRVALFDEYAMSGGRMVARQTAAKLRRFNAPVGVSVYFGASVPLSQREKDRADIAAYTGRLARATGHPVSMRRQNPNFLVLVLNEDERKSYHNRLRELVPGISPRDTSAILHMPLHTQCQVFAWAPQSDGNYSRAVAVVRAEHPDLTRLSCFHEELAQGLGLPNDSPEARPSVFNDDEEFGLLTSHDELLLKILYDPRLRPGMTAADARPVVKEIVADLISGT